MVRPVKDDVTMSDDELAIERAQSHEDNIASHAISAARGSFGLLGVIAWLAVGIPFLIGLTIALQKATALFTG
ncbi:MAG TPA: hypothetical protein P5227_12895, partial [Emcibacteraceae bacterium]|nr:hypothetical protein [Emcibacteraceae bacterium]